MKEMWKKYKRQIQIVGGICLIAVLGIGGYVAANQDTAVQTQTEMKKETKSSDQKIAKNDRKDLAGQSEQMPAGHSGFGSGTERYLLQESS